MAWRRAYGLALAGTSSSRGRRVSRAGERARLLVPRRRRPAHAPRDAAARLPEARIGALFSHGCSPRGAGDRGGGPESRLWLALAALSARPVSCGGRDSPRTAAVPDRGGPLRRQSFVLRHSRISPTAPARDRAGLLPALLAACYVAPGWGGAGRLTRAGDRVGRLAVAQQWPPATGRPGWTALSLLALVAERESGRPAAGSPRSGSPCSRSPACSASRSGPDIGRATFTDAWARRCTATSRARRSPHHRWGAGSMDPGTARWTARAGAAVGAVRAAVFAGGRSSCTLLRAAPLRSRRLALSLFWLAYAGALVRLGFQHERKDVRSAGSRWPPGRDSRSCYTTSTSIAYRIASFFHSRSSPRLRTP